jgi:hypothetical protein
LKHTPGYRDGPGRELRDAALKFEGRAVRLIERLRSIGDNRLAATDAQIETLDEQIRSTPDCRKP